MKMRVSAVQYHLHTITSFEQFAHQVEHYVKFAAEFEADFILFPEFFTTQLMSIGDDEGKALTIQQLPDFTESYRNLFMTLAKKKRICTSLLERMLSVKESDCTMWRICFTRMGKWLHKPNYI